MGRAPVLLNTIDRPAPLGLTGGGVVESSPERGLHARGALQLGAVMGSGRVLAWRRAFARLHSQRGTKTIVEGVKYVKRGIAPEKSSRDCLLGSEPVGNRFGLTPD